MSDVAITGWALVALVAALLALWIAWSAASRLDRLHRRVMESRAVLDAQLVRRATAALDLAVANVLDPVSSVLVADAAREALDHLPGAAALGPAPGSTGDAAGTRAAGDPPARPRGTQGPSASAERARPGLQWPVFAPEAEEIDQAMAESELSRVLRAALGGVGDRAALASVAGADELLERLDREWYRVQLARRFHNDAVVQVRRIRAKTLVRLLRLAGRAPLPQTFEMDDASTQP